MSNHYILDGHIPVQCSLMEWAKFFETHNRIVRQDKIDNGKVSTVFLGLDHQFGNGPPLLFETMIFGGPHDGYQERCSTWDEAEAQHEVAMKLVGGE